MVRKFISAGLVILAAGMFTACGNGAKSETASQSREENTEKTAVESGADVSQSDLAVYVKDIDAGAYVTLGEYKGLKVVVQDAAVNDADLEAYVNQEYLSHITEENGGVKDRAVAEGDTVIIDYEGKKDGVAFEGGTAQGADLTIGSGAFIPGFEDQLIGVMPGETVDLNLTFPETYKNNPDLAGAEVVFTVTVHYIMPTQIQDDVIAGFGLEQYQDEAGLRKYVAEMLEEYAQSEYQTNVENAVLQALVENCTYKENMPADLVDKYVENVNNQIQMIAAAYYGVDGETYANALYNMSLADFSKVAAENTVKQVLAFQLIADKENLNISDEELDKELEQYAKETGAESKEALLLQGEKEEYREYFMFRKVVDFLVENAVISNGTETE